MDNNAEITKYKDILWLKDTIEEILYKIKIHETNKFQYEIIEQDDDRILHFPSIPFFIIRKFKQLEVKFNQDKTINQINQLEDQRGYLIDNSLNLLNYGTCIILTEDFHKMLKDYINRRKFYINQTIRYFVNSFKSTIVKWKYNIVNSQRKLINNINDEYLQLKIIEGQAGTGKTEYIIRQITKYKGQVGIIVYGNGAIDTYLERLGEELDNLYVFSNKELNNKYQNILINKVNELKSQDHYIESLQNEWIELLNSSKDISSFLSMFSPAVIIKEYDVPKFISIVGPRKLTAIFTDDSNQFHPWSILEIFTLSDNITITGDNSQLKAMKNYDFLVKRLGLPENNYSSKLPTIQELNRIPRVKMNLNEELSTSVFISGNLKRLAKSFQSGLSFPDLELSDNMEPDLIERLKEITSFRDRSFFTIVKSWPVYGIISEKFIELYRYIGSYKSLLVKLGVIESMTYRNITLDDLNNICHDICTPITFYDFPIGDTEKMNYWNKSKYNIEEIDKIKEVVELIVDNSDKSILIVSGYGEQTKMIQKELKNITTNSNNIISILHVDSTSSLERDIVIISLTRNNTMKNIGHLENNRISMMLKRAREGVIIIGSSETFVKPRNENTEQRKIIKGLRDEAIILKTYHSSIGRSSS